MKDSLSSDSYLCPHGFDKRSVHCARCADPAFDSARGSEVAKAAMNTMHSSTGGPTVMTDHIPPGTKPTGTSKTVANPVAQRLRDHAKYGRFGDYNDVALSGAQEIDRLQAVITGMIQGLKDADAEARPAPETVSPPLLGCSRMMCEFHRSAEKIERDRRKLDWPSVKASVQLCAPHGKDWLTCPECAKAAGIGK